MAAVPTAVDQSAGLAVRASHAATVRPAARQRLGMVTARRAA